MCLDNPGSAPKMVSSGHAQEETPGSILSQARRSLGTTNGRCGPRLTLSIVSTRSDPASTPPRSSRPYRATTVPDCRNRAGFADLEGPVSGVQEPWRRDRWAVVVLVTTAVALAFGGWCLARSWERQRQMTLLDAHDAVPAVIVLAGAGILLLTVTFASAARRRERRTWQALHEAESRFRTLVENANQSVTVQVGGRFAYLNPEGVRLFGATDASQLVGQPVLDRIDPQCHEDVKGRLRAANVERRAVPPARITILRVDLRPVPVEISSAPIVYDGQNGSVVFTRDLTDYLATQQALMESEAHYRALFEDSPSPMWVFDLQSLAFLAVNAQACRHYGYTREEFAAMTLRDIRPPDELPRLAEIIGQIDESTSARTDLVRHRKKDGTIIDVGVTGQSVRFAGRAARMVVIDDLTERNRLQQQLRQAQRMEAVGRLAGGVAHDFNNLLTVINNYADFALEGLPEAAPRRDDLVQVRAAGERAAQLAGQLLAFSRRQVLQPQVLDLNAVVGSIQPMLQRLIGEHIELVPALAPDALIVHADRGQLEQVVVNLVVNARDAMPRGGLVRVETASVELDDGYARTHPSVSPGPHALLAVTDTGDGMDSATQAQVFEPFFTTKPAGQGTGLGLSTVYGIVKQSGGSIWVYSELGRGSTFKVYLPICPDAVAAEAERTTAAGTGGSETILLVEDEAGVRTASQRVLSGAGYRVLSASNGVEALSVVAGHTGRIHLMVTDVVMPQMSGRQLASELCAARPDLKVLYMSGYTQDAIGNHGVLQPGVAFIPKPFAAADLIRKVRAVLDAR
jgi:two-component system, cell cycle sensor histidine kinase and response regulator CckA